MPVNRINNNKLLRLLDSGKTQAEAARALGVSPQAVNQRLQELRGRATKVIVADKKTAKLVDRKIDAIEQLQKINDYANEMLDLLMRWQRGDDEALQILESQVRRVNVGSKKNPEWVKQYKMKDPRQLALKAMAEIRGQLKLQLEIFQALFSLQAAEEFEATVLEVIGEVSDDVRAEIIRRINQKRSVRSAVRLA